VSGLETVPPRRLGSGSARGPPASQTRKTGLAPGLPYVGAISAEQDLLPATYRAEGRTPRPAWCLRAFPARSERHRERHTSRGDGSQPHRLRSPRSREVRVSHAAIAALLARQDLSSGERLVAWSLASCANRDQRAWPGIPPASARAGLSRSRYLELRDRLVRRGLHELETPGVGRRRASTGNVRLRSPVRGRRTRSTSTCSTPCSGTARPGDRRGCCWPRSPGSPMRTATSKA
jgi:hypothetical protein